MSPEEILDLLRNRASELKQQCEAKMRSIQTVGRATETEEQRNIRDSAQADFHCLRRALSIDRTDRGKLNFTVMKRKTLLACLIAAPILLLAKDRSWKEGSLTAVEMRDFMTGKNHNLIAHRYICTVSDGAFSYVVEYEKPLKLAVHDVLKFVTEKDNLIILDADGKERSARVEKRERIQTDEGKGHNRS